MKQLFAILILLIALPAHSEVILQDNFEYAVARTGTAADAFASTGPWGGVKADNATNSSAAGIFSTETSIPGFTGSFPGTNSTRVLRLHIYPNTAGYQSSANLNYGGGVIGNDDIPATVYIQHWIYINNDSGSGETSTFSARNKWLYPCDGSYGCSNDADDNGNKWMVQSGPGFVGGSGGDNYMGFGTRDDTAYDTDSSVGRPWLSVEHTPSDSYEEKLYQNLDHTTYVTPNSWFLVKFRFSTGASSGNIYEAWIAPQGGSFTKVAEFIPGTTDNFTWNLESGYPGGHSIIAFPSTFPGGASPPYYDSWIYIDDFIIATEESDLPTYGDTSGASVRVGGQGVTLE